MSELLLVRRNRNWQAFVSQLNGHGGLVNHNHLIPTYSWGACCLYISLLTSLVRSTMSLELVNLILILSTVCLSSLVVNTTTYLQINKVGRE